MNCKNYFLGLDIGTDSVGYAATDKEYSLLKHRGEPMWGVTLFDEAKLNAERRLFRTARRRLDRRQQRVTLLQELFAKEIGKTDERFFIRLKGSALNREDTDDVGTVFEDAAYSDAQYHKEYPTIHHLIRELMTSDKPHDVRLVYLACAWLVAHRGHFLYEVDAEHIDEIRDFRRVYRALTDCLCERGENTTLPWKQDDETVAALAEALKKKNSVTAKGREVSLALFGQPKLPKSADGASVNFESLWKMICGFGTAAKKLFDNEEYSEIESFSMDADDEKLAQILAQLNDDDALLLTRAKAVYDWALLGALLDGSDSISEAKVRVYEQHKTDLQFLKRFAKEYVPQQYGPIFRDIRKDNYVAYSYHCKDQGKTLPDKKAKKDDFSKYLLGIVSSVQPEETDLEKWEDMKSRLALRTFLPKQRDGDNRVIPYQLYLAELNEILRRAEKYLPFLAEKDEDGRSISDKVRAIFRFRVPYFVGPLNPHSERAWVKFRSEKSGKIYPWNFSEVVDEDASEDAFIRRMTNKCTYYPGEDVLPKDSLLYSRFTVLNEINNLRIDGERIPVAVKQAIYTELYEKQRKVTPKKIKDYLLSIGAMEKGQVLGGLDATDDKVHSDLKPWHDFRRLLASGTLNTEQAERIIERRTYTDDRTRFAKWLKREYPALSDDDIQYIARLSYHDFGRLSGKFLTELPGIAKTSGTGEAFSVIRAMWETNDNLMELLSDRYTFRESVEELQRDYYAGHSGSLNERLEEMRISNAVKRPILRALEITKEVVKAAGSPPEKIFVEMMRGGEPEQKGRRTKSRRERILELYAKCRDEDVRILRGELEAMGDDADSRLQGDRLFLYYMQLGKCMYTGENIDLARLKDGTYNIEHIYPQSYVKDDSIINNEVLVLSEVNGEKSDTYPIKTEIRAKMHGFWSALHQTGMISDEKYKRLTRSIPFSEDEKLGFINRQKVETSQATKAVATLLKEYYPDTEIVYVKAKLTTDFRKAFGMLKSRSYNDLHHAKDAYLNIVTGNVYDMKFSGRWFDVNSRYSVKAEAIFTHPVICGGETVWNGEPMLAKVKNTVNKNNAHVTKYAFCRRGGLFKQNPLKAAPGLIPRKADLPTEKYGGYKEPTVSFFILTRYSVGKKRDIMIMPVELRFRDRFSESESSAAEYAKARIGGILGKPVDEVSFPLGMRIIKINTVLSLDGFRVCVAGGSGGGKNIIVSPLMPFAADRKTETYLKRLEAMAEKTKNPRFVYHPEYDKVTAEENMALYELYLQKLRDSVYAKRPNNPLQTLADGKEKFAALAPVEQAKALLNIHQVFGRIAGGCDLTAVGGSGHAAATNGLSSNLSNWKKAYKEVYMIDSSAAGLWEKQSGNLLDLL